MASVGTTGGVSAEVDSIATTTHLHTQIMPGIACTLSFR